MPQVFQIIAIDESDPHFESDIVNDDYHAGLGCTHRTVCGIQLDGEDGIGPGEEKKGRVTCGLCLIIIKETQAIKLPTSKITEREKNLLWQLMRFNITRYLLSCTSGRESGAMQADNHIALVSIFVGFAKLCAFDFAIQNHDEYWELVHEETQELTGFLDIRIGFPLNDTGPDYEKLAPLFFEQFIQLADSVEVGQ